MKKEQGFILPIIIVVLVIAVLGTAGYFVYKQYSALKITACTQEAKICPDGSSVGRTGPNCEFAECPNQTAGSPVQSQQATEGWKTYTNDEYGFEIKYPANGWNLLVDAPRGNILHLIQIGVITESDDFAGSVQLYIQSGNVDFWLSNKATHTRETVYINGLRAEKFYFGRDLKTDTSLTYVFERNNLVYVINTSLVIGNKYGISETDISQILSTFKFTPVK